MTTRHSLVVTETFTVRHLASLKVGRRPRVLCRRPKRVPWYVLLLGLPERWRAIVLLFARAQSQDTSFSCSPRSNSHAIQTFLSVLGNGRGFGVTLLSSRCAPT